MEAFQTAWLLSRCRPRASCLALPNNILAKNASCLYITGDSGNFGQAILPIRTLTDRIYLAFHHIVKKSYSSFTF